MDNNNNLVDYANKILQKCLDNVISDMKLDGLGKFYVYIDAHNDAEISFAPYLDTLKEEADSNSFALAFVDEKGNIAPNLNNVPTNNYQVKDLRGKDKTIAEKFVKQIKSLI